MAGFYQQGDIILEQVGEVQGFSVKHDGVLAHGDATGHAHRIADLTGLAFFDRDGVLYLKAEKPFTLTHEKHGPHTLPAGAYRMRKVREYDHFSEEAREVID